MPGQFTLLELHQYIQRIFYLNFEESVWIEAEISESRLHNGHYYLTLIEKNETGGLVAKASASLWNSRVAILKHRFSELFTQLIRAGNKVRIRCGVEFHPRYGYSLMVKDFDSSYTEGYLYLERKKTIERIQREGLMELNASLPLPIVVKRIAVISSETAAGYQDFIHQLHRNNYGYQFEIHLFQSRMQGETVKSELPKALEKINHLASEYDIIVVVRGGGASIDLTDFDHYDVAKSIAEASLPVISGIGHERDWSVADMVSAVRVKTPTAAAEWIIQNNLIYEASITNLYSDIAHLTSAKVTSAQYYLESAQNDIVRRIEGLLLDESYYLEKQNFSLRNLLSESVYCENLKLRDLFSAVKELNPFEIMKRGYAMIYQNDRRIRDLDELEVEKLFTLYMNRKKSEINGNGSNSS